MSGKGPTGSGDQGTADDHLHRDHHDGCRTGAWVSGAEVGFEVPDLDGFVQSLTGKVVWFVTGLVTGRCVEWQ